ncbi:MAG: hypothetical protein HYT73_00795 [Candidatus Aenigmarchaeota archaeon]|nr:hypothetical protein [Candidatus Aenigmarchaeota archaeon]
MQAQIIDADYFLNGNKPVIRIFAKTESGNTICVFYDKFLPYFFIVPTAGTAGKLKEIPEIRSVEEVERFEPLGYSKEKTKMLKITVTNPQDVPKIRETLAPYTKNIYEADILFKYRFMVDHGLYGMKWIDFDGERVRTNTVKVPAFRTEEIRSADRNDNVPLRHMSVDIECLPSDPRKPLDSKNDPIIIISMSFAPHFRDKKNLVLLAKNFYGDDIKGFQTEKEMLEEFVRILDAYDPDIITGYNINSFDLPYLAERFRHHKMPTNFGRSEKMSFGKTFGILQEFIISGRVVVDPYQILKRDPWMKFPRYDLNTVSKILLGDEKHDVEYGKMAGLWNGTKEQISTFLEYARQDANLSIRLVIERGMLDKFVELAKISGLLLQDLFGGQTKRVETMALHEFRKRGFVMPPAPSKGELARRAKERESQGLKGATVLEPEKGLHAEGCILVLDFKSLYPSIMRTFNISPETAIKTPVENCYASPSGAYFVRPETKSGILPDILSTLVDARTAVKKQMKNSKPEEKRMLNAKQLAIKDMSNSFYGYTGYIRARLYMIDVAGSITAYGRDNIIKTKNLVEKNFPARVVYGDTDSIFVKTDMTNLEDAKKLGEDIASFVTSNLEGHLELQFEKIYRTFLILTKKRYAGWKFEHTGTEWKNSIDMKGIETVRRDWCPLVSELMLKIINIMLKEGDIHLAMNEVKGILDKLKRGEIPLEKLTVIKGLTKSIENYDGMLPHIEVAKKLAARNPHDPPKIGDRIGFVILKGNNHLLSKRADDPKYVAENGLQIDSEYYISSQLLPPIERILNSVGVERTELLGGGRQSRLGDIMSGAKRKMKHDIVVDYNKPEQPLAGWEEFLCKKCSKSYSRMPLRGVCECGGQLLFGFHGSVGTRLVAKQNGILHNQ